MMDTSSDLLPITKENTFRLRNMFKIMVQDMIYHIDVYDVMKRDIARFDTSDYSAYNAYGMPLANKKVPGLIKDENNDVIMTEFLERRCTR